MARKIRESRELLKIYVERIKSLRKDSMIILFGSRARGGELPYSDYDVAIVLRHVDDRLTAIEEFRRVKPPGLDLDLMVLSVDELDDPLIKSMLKDSIILYDGLGNARHMIGCGRSPRL